MTTEVPTRTTTEVVNKKVSINCVPSLNDNGEEKPSIYSSKILEERATIDNASGIEGELIISSTEENPANINSDGELIISLENDDVNKYSIDRTNGDLLYEE